MKKIRGLLLTLLMTLLFTANIFAEHIDSASNSFNFNDIINITKEIKGDTYILGRNISIEEIIGGDVIGMGETVNINSKEVNGNIRCISRVLNINSKNIKNITSTGQVINIGKDTTAQGVYLSGEEINFKGKCEGFYATGGTIIINGNIDGDLNVTCDEFIIAKNGNITGSIKVNSPKEPIVNSNVSINDIDYTKIENDKYENKFKSLIGFGTLISILASLLIGIIIYSIFKKFFTSSDKVLMNEPFTVALSGIGSLLVIPIISILLFITIIGLPLGIITFIMYFIVLYLSPTIMGIVTGRLIFKDKNPYLQLLGGIIIIRLLSLIPFIGGITWVLSGVIVQGLITYEFYKNIIYKENKKLI